MPAILADITFLQWLALVGAALLIGCYVIAIGGTAFVITAGIELARSLFQ